MKNFKYRKKLVLFDLDGVLVDSKKNMQHSWDLTSKQFDLNVPFSRYFSFVGKPFKDILKSLRIKKNYKLIHSTFSSNSRKNFNKIKIYPGIKETLRYLRKKKVIIGVVTSKDEFRTKKILARFSIKAKIVQCPEKGLRGKPYPDQLNVAVKKVGIKKMHSIYVGDTRYDKKAAKAAKIDFLLAKYGYKIGIKKSEYFVNYPKQIKNLF